MSNTTNISGRNRFPFTASQWQELEHQALIFKYMVSGIPIPPDLLFTIKRNCFDSPLSPKLFAHQHQHIGWSCFPIGLGRKIDPEPGRCRRTDGKKWRCSKEAYPDSKYCERHMHRGKNRSRKPVEVELTNTTTTTMLPSSLTKNSSHAQTQLLYPAAYNNSHLHHPFLYSSKPPGTGLSPQETFNLNSTHLVLDSGSASQTDADFRNRYGHGLRVEDDQHTFFSEQSGNTRSFSGSSMDDSWQLTPLTISSSSSSSSSSKQRSCTGLQSDYSYLQLQSLNDQTTKQDKQDQHCYVLGTEIKCEMQREQGPQKTVHRFFDEWPPKTRDSWLDLDDKSPNTASISTTRLSIAIPSTHDFPIYNSRAP